MYLFGLQTTNMPPHLKVGGLQSAVSSFSRNWYHMHHRVTRSFTEEIKVFPLSLAAGAHLGEGGRFISISRHRSCPISKLPFSGGGSQCFQGVRFVR